MERKMKKRKPTLNVKTIKFTFNVEWEHIDLYTRCCIIDNETGVVISEDVVYLNYRDLYNENIAKKESLKLAVIGLPKVQRSSIWKSYFAWRKDLENSMPKIYAIRRVRELQQSRSKDIINLNKNADKLRDKIHKFYTSRIKPFKDQLLK